MIALLAQVAVPVCMTILNGVASFGPCPPGASPAPIVSPLPASTPTPFPTGVPSAKPTILPTVAPTVAPTALPPASFGYPRQCVDLYPTSPLCQPFSGTLVANSNSTKWDQQQGNDVFSPEVIDELGLSQNDGSFPSTYPPASSLQAQKLACNVVSYSSSVCTNKAPNANSTQNMNGATVMLPKNFIVEGTSDRHLNVGIASLHGTFSCWLCNGATYPKNPNSFASGATVPVGGAGFCPWAGDGTGCSGSYATYIAGDLGNIDPNELLLALESGDPHSTLGHAIKVFPECNGTLWMPPASASDGQCEKGPNGSNIATSSGLPEGSRGYYPLTDDQVNAMNIPDFQKVLIRTADEQHYGVVDSDTNWGGSPYGMTMAYQGGQAYSQMGLADPWQAVLKYEQAEGNGKYFSTGESGHEITMTMGFSGAQIQWCNLWACNK